MYGSISVLSISTNSTLRPGKRSRAKPYAASDAVSSSPTSETSETTSVFLRKVSVLTA